MWIWDNDGPSNHGENPYSVASKSSSATGQVWRFAVSFRTPRSAPQVTASACKPRFSRSFRSLGETSSLGLKGFLKISHFDHQIIHNSTILVVLKPLLGILHLKKLPEDRTSECLHECQGCSPLLCQTTGWNGRVVDLTLNHMDHMDYMDLVIIKVCAKQQESTSSMDSMSMIKWIYIYIYTTVYIYIHYIYIYIYTLYIYMSIG